MSAEVFFDEDELNGYVDRINRLVNRNNHQQNYAHGLTVIAECLETISEDVFLWDQKCLYCIEKYGTGLKKFFNEIESVQHSEIMKNWIVIYCFFREFKFFTDENLFNVTDLTISFNRLEQAIETYAGVDEVYKKSFERIELKIDTEILRSRINKEEFRVLLEEALSRKVLDDRIANLTTLLNSKTKLIEALDEKISNLRTEYNFIGLYKGFQDVSKKKETARKDALKFTYMLGAALISVPFLIIILGFAMQYRGLLDLTLLQFLALPVISAEIFLFYYFRLKYLEVKSFDAQLLQLDVRMSLCQFVEAYSKFATEIHKESPGLLSNFETLIFSPIVAKESDIPPLIDGANQISDLIAKIRR